MVMASLILPVMMHWMVWSYSWWYPAPVVKVDYVAQFNEWRKPANYKVEDDGTQLFIKACSMMENVKVPEFERVEIVKDAKRPEQENLRAVTWPGDMNDAEVKELKAWLAAHDGAFQTLERAMGKKCFWTKAKSSYGSDMLYVLSGQLSGIKSLTYGLVWRGKVKAWGGDITGGLDDEVAVMNLGKCFGAKPTIVEWLVGVAVSAKGYDAIREIASRTSVSSKQLEIMSSAIEDAGKRWRSLEPSMEFERLMIIDQIQRYFGDDGSGGGRLNLRAVYSSRCFQVGGESVSNANENPDFEEAITCVGIYALTEDRQATLARSERVFRKVLEVSKIEPYRLATSGNDPWTDYHAALKANAFLNILMANCPKIVTLLHRHGNEVKGTVGGIAVLRYKAETGKLPNGWEDVVKKGYLKEVPIDPFSGKALIYKKVGDGFTVYSVREDGKDDGGDRKKDRVYWPVERQE